MLKIPKLSIPKTFTPPFRLVGRQIHSQGYFISLKSQKILYCKLGQGCHFILFIFFFFFFFFNFLINTPRAGLQAVPRTTDVEHTFRILLYLFFSFLAFWGVF